MPSLKNKSKKKYDKKANAIQCGQDNGFREKILIDDSGKSENIKLNQGILLLQMGGPNSLDEVESFLFNLFSDKYIIQLPWFLQPLQKNLAKFISKRRAAKVQELYKEIGGKSPIGFETKCQALALEKYLNRSLDLNSKIKVYYAMRYSHPFLKDTFEKIQSDDINDLTVIPLYPQYSLATSGSSMIECKELFDQNGFAKKAQIKYIESWHDDENFIRLIHDRIRAKLNEFTDEGTDLSRVWILFSAHGLPQKYVDQGDPYQEQVLETMALIMGRFPMMNYSIAYQSRVGPVRWLGPSTDKEIKRLARDLKVKNILVVPISFVGDHIETLSEINIEYKKLAESYGVESFKTTRLPKANSLLIKALANKVYSASSSKI